MLKELGMGLAGTNKYAICNPITTLLQGGNPFSENKMDTVDIFNWDNLELSHLRLSSTVISKAYHNEIIILDHFQGAVPVLLTEEGIPLTGEDIYRHLDRKTSPG